MPVDPVRALKIARAAAAEAGALLLRGHQEEIHVQNKGAIDLVTEWDQRSEELVVSTIQEAFPGHTVVAEEGHGGGGETDPGVTEACWFIDPLDGTTNYAHRLPIYAVSIALELDGRLEVGVVNAPYLGWEFYAQRGGGAWLNGERIQVSRHPDLLHSIASSGFPYDRRTSTDNNLDRMALVVPEVQGFRRLGVAALDCALVAWGRMETYWEVKIKPWDVAAGVLLIQEAGGRVTNLDGEPFDLHRGRILASNGLVHDEMVKLLAGT